MIFTTVPVNDLMQQLRAIVRDELVQQQKAEERERLLTPKETADLLRVSLVTLWNWTRAGRLKKYAMGGKTFFKQGEVLAGLETMERYKKHVVGRDAA